jgi:hypothetical protein
MWTKSSPQLNKFTLNFLDHFNISIKQSNKYFKPLQETDISNLLKNEHLIYFNTQTIHIGYLLFTIIENKHMILFFHKKYQQTYTLNHTIYGELFKNNVVFEGEILNDMNDSSPKFLISDVLNADNHTFMNLKTNLKYISNFVYNFKVLTCNLTLLVKEFVEYKYLKSFYTDYKKQVDYSNTITGVVFRPVSLSNNQNIYVIFDKQHLHPMSDKFYNFLNLSTNVKTNKFDTLNGELTSSIIYDDSKHPFIDEKSILNLIKKYEELEETIKSKEIKYTVQESDTLIDFQVKKTDLPDVYELYLYNSQNILFNYDIALVPTLESSIYLYKLFENNTILNLKCKYHPKFNKWQPIDTTNKINNIIDIM